MVSKRRMSIALLCIVLSVLFMTAGMSPAADEKQPAETGKKPTLSLSGDMGKAMIQEAAKVKDEFERQAKSLFERTPLGWDLETVDYLFEKIFSLPREIPKSSRQTRARTSYRSSAPTMCQCASSRDDPGHPSSGHQLAAGACPARTR